MTMKSDVFYKTRPAIITGANGQVGKEIVKVFKSKGIPILPFDRKGLDISDRSRVGEIIFSEQPSLVINSAAYTAVDLAEKEQEKAFLINAEGVKNLADTCAKVSIPLFHISTDYVFNGEKDAPYTEEDQTGPQGAYGLSKLNGEKFLIKILPEHIILRTSWVFGRYGKNFIKTILRLGSKRDELKIVSDQKGCPTPAQDVAWVLQILAEKFFKETNLSWGTYHYAGTPGVTWFEFAQAVLEEAHSLAMLKKVPVLHAVTTSEYPTPAKRPANSQLNCEKIQKTFGLEVRSWRPGLIEVLKGIKKGDEA
jgi:dTDP-4-dehydrorhamnose reductase